jgi:hypothetical protein
MAVSSVGLTQLAAAAQATTEGVQNAKKSSEQTPDTTPAVKAAVPSTVGKAIDISA